MDTQPNDNRDSGATAASSFGLKSSANEVEFGQPLEITWDHTNNKHAFGDPADFIIALTCANDPSSASDLNNVGTTLMDAATLSQIKATHLHHNQKIQPSLSHMESSNRWVLPSFPLIHSNHCVFSLLTKKMSLHNHSPNQNQYHILSQTSISLTSSQELPTSIHLGLSSDPHSRYIQFTTGIAGGSVVEIGPRTSNPDDEITFVKWTGSSITYTAEEMCFTPDTTATTNDQGFVPPGYLHTVKIEQLKENTHYVYRVGLAMGQGVRWSEYQEFQTPTWTTSSSSSVTKFLVLGDQGCEQSLDSSTPAAAPSVMIDTHVRSGKAAAQDVASLLLSIVQNETISSIHHLGDLSYADGTGHIWDQYMAMIEPYASRVPITVGVGNHEYDHTWGGQGKDPSGVVSDGGFQPYWGNFNDASGGECGVPLSKRFAVPENGNGVFW